MLHILFYILLIICILYIIKYNYLKLCSFHRTSYILISVMDSLSNSLRYIGNFKDWSFQEANESGREEANLPYRRILNNICR